MALFTLTIKQKEIINKGFVICTTGLALSLLVVNILFG